MNDVEFVNLLAELEVLDAQQFEDAVGRLSNIAREVYEHGDRRDYAWKVAADDLLRASYAVAGRAGN